MEHEKIIQQKLLAMESLPVVWDKERVWSNVRPEKQGRSSFHLGYYAAASLLVAAVLYFYWPTADVSPSSETKMASIESKSEGLQKQNTVEEKNIPASNGEKKMSALPVKKRIGGIKAALPDSIRPVSLEPILPAEDPRISLLEEEYRAVTQPPVEAIIGVIPEQKQNIVVIRTKKMHVRLLRDSEKEYRESTVDGHHRILSARIN